MVHEHGWFHHFINLRTGALMVRQCFSADPDVPRLADAIYRRVDFQWMLAGRQEEDERSSVRPLRNLAPVSQPDVEHVPQLDLSAISTFCGFGR